MTEEQLLKISNLGCKENIEFSIELKSDIVLEKITHTSKYVRSIPTLMLNFRENEINSEITCSGFMCVKFGMEVCNSDYARSLIVVELVSNLDHRPGLRSNRYIMCCINLILFYLKRRLRIITKNLETKERDILSIVDLCNLWEGGRM